MGFEEESSSPQALTNTLIDLSDVPEATVTTKPAVVINSYLDALRDIVLPPQAPKAEAPEEASKEAPTLLETCDAVGPGFQLIIQPPTEEAATGMEAESKRLSGAESATLGLPGNARSPSLSPPNGHTPSDQQRVDSKEIETAFLNMKATSFDYISKHISQDALKFLHGLSKEAYDDMIQMVTSSMERPNEPTDSLLEQAHHSSSPAFQIVWTHLGRYDEYKRLTSDDQKLVQSVVYANALHGHGRLIHSPRSIRKLKVTGQSCPDEIKELNALVRSGNDLQGWQNYAPSRSSQGSPSPSSLKRDGFQMGWQNFASGSASQGSPNSSSLKQDGSHIDQPLASEATRAKSSEVGQTHTPERQVDDSTANKNLKAQENTSHNSHASSDNDKNKFRPVSGWDRVDTDEDEIRPPSGWDTVDTDETVEPQTYSTSRLPASRESVTDGRSEPPRTLSNSRWALSSSQQHSPNTSFGLDGTISGRSDAPRSSGHVRTNTEATNKSDMSVLANQMGSAPSHCSQA